MPSKRKYNARFPPARIKKIMQKDEEVGKVAATVPVIISRALEIFIQSLLSKAVDHTKTKQAKTLTALHLKQVILAERQFDFLKDLVCKVPDAQNLTPEDDDTATTSKISSSGDKAGIDDAGPIRKESSTSSRPRGRPKKVALECELARKRRKTSRRHDDDTSSQDSSGSMDPDSDCDGEHNDRPAVQAATAPSSTPVQQAAITPSSTPVQVTTMPSPAPGQAAVMPLFIPVQAAKMSSNQDSVFVSPKTPQTQGAGLPLGQVEGTQTQGAGLPLGQVEGTQTQGAGLQWGHVDGVQTQGAGLQWGHVDGAQTQGAGLPWGHVDGVYGCLGTRSSHATLTKIPRDEGCYRGYVPCGQKVQVEILDSAEKEGSVVADRVMDSGSDVAGSLDGCGLDVVIPVDGATDTKGSADVLLDSGCGVIPPVDIARTNFGGMPPVDDITLNTKFGVMPPVDDILTSAKGCVVPPFDIMTTQGEVVPPADDIMSTESAGMDQSEEEATRTDPSRNDHCLDNANTTVTGVGQGLSTAQPAASSDRYLMEEEFASDDQPLNRVHTPTSRRSVSAELSPTSGQALDTTQSPPSGQGASPVMTHPSTEVPGVYSPSRSLSTAPTFIHGLNVFTTCQTLTTAPTYIQGPFAHAIPINMGEAFGHTGLPSGTGLQLGGAAPLYGTLPSHPLLYHPLPAMHPALLQAPGSMNLGYQPATTMSFGVPAGTYGFTQGPVGMIAPGYPGPGYTGQFVPTLLAPQYLPAAGMMPTFNPQSMQFFIHSSLPPNTQANQ